MRAGGRFAGQVVVITGASSGIGAELARQFAAEGARVALAARDVARLEAVAAECRARGGEALVVPTDVTRDADCTRLVADTVAHFGRLDVLVANAGASMRARFDEVSDRSVFERLMRLNYLGAVWCTAAALPHLEATRGRVVGISSLAGLTGVPQRTGYAASKHAMAGFFDSLRLELQGRGVSVTMIYPGFVASEIGRRALGPDGQPMGERVVAHRRGGTMPTDVCARLILDATHRRAREVVMTRTARLGRWLRLLSPALVDRLTLWMTGPRG